MRLTIGIDPGKTGGVNVLNQDRELIEVADMPT